MQRFFRHLRNQNRAEQNQSLTPAQGRQNSRVGCLLTTTTIISCHIKAKPFLSANPQRTLRLIYWAIRERTFSLCEYTRCEYIKLAFKLRLPISNRGLSTSSTDVKRAHPPINPTPEGPFRRPTPPQPDRALDDARVSRSHEYRRRGAQRRLQKDRA